MSTTSLNVEIVIIGIETFIWGIFAVADTSGGFNTLIAVGKIMNSFGGTILLIGILYILGAIIDRVADKIFEKKEEALRGQSGITAKSALLTLEKDKQVKFLYYVRTRMRILRATFINSFFITGSISFFIIRFSMNLPLLVFVIVVGIATAIITYKGALQSIKIFFDQAHKLESENNP